VKLVEQRLSSTSSTGVATINSTNPTMAKSISTFVAVISLLIPGSHAFVLAPGALRANNVRLSAKLEGREIEGTLTPTNNFVLVKKAAVLDETAGGILLTGSVSFAVFSIEGMGGGAGLGSSAECINDSDASASILTCTYSIQCNRRPKSRRRKEVSSP
jgi:hypothetical protein